MFCSCHMVEMDHISLKFKFGTLELSNKKLLSFYVLQSRWKGKNIQTVVCCKLCYNENNSDQ